MESESSESKAENRLKEFEITLKEAVRGKRLSQSKLEKTTAIAMKSMDNDTKLVSIIYRTHKALQPACKVNGLYAFDALARAARSYATKHKLSAKSEKGNCATFLLKMEGVLDSLVKDMVTCELEEAKEKTKKVLDIWSKANTFPAAVITRLHKRVDGVKEEPNISALGSPPRDDKGPTPPPASGTPTGDPNATLLALLSQAASAVGNNVQIPPNTSGSDLTAIQAALVQHLAQAATAPGVPNIPNAMTAPAATPPVHVPVVPFPLPNFQPPMQTYFPHQAGGIPGVEPTRAYAQPSFPPPNAPPFPYAAPPPQTFAAPPHNGHDSRVNHDPRRNTPNPNGPGPNLPSRPGFDGRDPRRSWQDTGSSNRDMRHNGKPGVDGPGSYANGTSDGFRGRGGARGRGRGRGQWEDRTSFDERRPPQKRERSMSPPHAGRGYGSPQGSDHDLSRPSINKAAAAATGKDEFGRDIRSGSPDAEDPVPVRSQPPRSSAVESTNATTASGASVDRPSNVPKPKHEPPSVQTIPVLYAQPGPAALPTPSVSVKPTPTGLHAFDFATFDFTNPESWTSLGQAWKVTNGVDPSQEQLMQFVMSGGPQALQDGQPAGEAIAHSATIPNVHGQQWQSNYVQEPPQPLQQIGTYGDGMQQGSGTMGGFGGGGGHRGGRGGGRGRGNFRRNQEDYSAYSGTQSTDEFVVGIQPEANGNYMNQMNGYY